MDHLGEKMKAFGTEFIVISDVIQQLDTKVFKGGPWTHLATIKRGFKEYMAFTKKGTTKVWVEEIDERDPNLLKVIEDENEWNDIIMFLQDAKILEVGMRKELHIATNKGI